jgi:serpin B
MRTVLGIVVAAALLVAGCGSDTSPGDENAVVPHVPQPTGSFALDLLRALPDGNVVVGPESVDAVLSMILAGAKGPTADELRQALGHDVPTSWIGSRSSDGVTLDISATTWLDKTFKPLAEFSRTLESTWKAKPFTVDFAHDPKGAERAINADVSKNTHGHIPKLLDGQVDDQTVAVLVSATYLDAKWQEPFSHGSTGPRSFTLADGKQVNVPTMHRTGAYATGSGEGWRAVELPYADGQTSMLVVVPDDLAAFERSLSDSTIDRVRASLGEPQSVELRLPKFEQRTREGLKGVLATLGVRTMFTDSADLSGVSEQSLKVSFVQHEAWIQVDEDGTKAAAATAGGMMPTSAPAQPATFYVDRPFLFFITDKPSGSMLFAGRVVNPQT